MLSIVCYLAALVSPLEPCRLSVLSAFGPLAVACAQHPLPNCRKLAVKLAEAWLGFVHELASSSSLSSSPSSSSSSLPSSSSVSARPAKGKLGMAGRATGLLATLAVEDPDAGVQVRKQPHIRRGSAFKKTAVCCAFLSWTFNIC
jgi:hypothetical protein